MRVPQRRWFLAAFLVSALALILAGVWVYRSRMDRIAHDAQAQLEAIAFLKVTQIAQWRAERLGDASVVMDSRFFTEAISRWLKDPQPADAEGILSRFRALQASYGYDDILLMDAEGQVRLSLSGETGIAHEAAMPDVEIAWREKRPMLTELHEASDHAIPHLGAIAPLFDENGAPLGVVFLRMDARSFLYPLIQTWPLPSQSAETLIVRRDGDDVIFLNELRHQEGAALNLRIPLTETDVPAVAAVLGHRGLYEGMDYRGVEVVSIISEIPDSPWFMVAKIDRAEIYAQWRLYSVVLGGLFAALLASLATGAIALWQGREKSYFQTLAQAHAALHASEMRYRTTLLSVGDGVIVTDAQGRVEIMNAAAEELTGWRLAEAQGQPIERVFAVVNEETHEPVENPATRVLVEGAVVGLANHTVLMGRDGVERPIADSGAPVRDETGAANGVVLVFRDQTEERAAQRAVAESEAGFRALFDASPLAIAMYDLAGRLVQCNRTMSDMLGYTSEELGEIDPTHPDDRASGAELFQQLVRGEIDRYQREKRYIRKDGSTLWAYLTAAPILDAEGRPQHVVLVFEDTSQRRQAQEALRESEIRFRGLFEHSLSGVAVHEIVLDGQGKPVDYRFLDANPAFEAHTGIAAADVIGRRATEVFSNGEAPYVATYARAALEGEPASFETYYEPLDRDFSINVFQVSPGQFATVFVDITERRRAEEALRESSELLRIAGRLTRMGGWAVDLETNQVTWSDQVAEIHGMPPGYSPSLEDGIGFYAPEYSERISQAYDDCASRGIPYDEEMQIINAQGERVWVRTIGVPVRDESGAIVKVQGGFQDITERMEAAEALRESEARYRRIVETATEGIWQVDAQSRVVFANRRGAGMLGYEPSEMIGQPTQRFVHPDEYDHLHEMQQRRRQGLADTYERRLLGKNGETVWVLISAAPITAPDGGFAGSFAMFADITERKLAEDALRESEERYRLLAENTVDAIWLLDLDLTFRYINPAVEAMSGAKVEEWLGSNLSDHCDEENMAIMRRAISAAFEALPQQRAMVFEVEMLRKDGGPMPVEITGKVLVDDHGTPIGLQGVTRDITERRRAQEALAQERLLLRTVIDHLPDAVYVKDVQARKMLANPADLRNMGAREEAEVLGKTDAECFDEETAERLMADDRVVLETGRPLLNREELLVRPDGEKRWLATSKLPLRDSEGRITGLVGLGRDITARKQDEAHRALQSRRIETLLKLHEMADATQEEIMSFALQACLDVVQSVLAFVGLMNDDETNLRVHAWSQQAMAQCALDSRPLDFVVAESGLWAECVRQRAPLVINDYRTPHPGKRGYPPGHVALERLLCVPVFDGEHIVAVAAVANKEEPYDAEDISALTVLMNKMWELLHHREYEMRLAESEARYRRLADHAPDVIFRYRVSPEPGLEYINPAIETITGYSPEECYADPHLMIRWAHPEDAPFMADLVSTRTFLGRPFVLRWLGKDQTVHWMETRVIPIQEPDGELIAVEGIARDVTQRVLEEQERQQLEQRLLESQKIEAVGRLAGGVAHDFNNMLQTILGYTEMAIQDAPPDEPLSDYLREIRAAGQRSAALTRQLLAFARRQTIQPRALDLNEHVSTTLKMLERLIGEDISLVWKPADRLGQVVMDPSQVDQILANLIVNARDAIEGVGEIIIETQNATITDEYVVSHPEALPGDYVMLVVTDNGCGMDPETQAHLFEPFFTTKPVGEGTGLGLATVYGIVRQNEGFVNVYSEMERGTTFRIYLPRQDVEMEETDASGEPSALPRGTETVLLVEDETALLKLGTRLLLQLGYTVLSASSPDEALRLQQEHQGEIHLLMTDVVMPGMNGRELADKIRLRRPDTKCLFMSGYTANVIAHRGVVDDNVAFLQKPFSLETLARHVRAALDGRPIRPRAL